jgi:hypothetical protein
MGKNLLARLLLGNCKSIEDQVNSYRTHIWLAWWELGPRLAGW